MTAPRRRLLAAAALAALALSALFAPRHLAPWFIGSGALALVGTWLSARAERQGPRAIVRGLVATWAELPGATVDGDRIRVHDGMQPLVVHLGYAGGALRAVVQTVAHEGPCAWRVWPRDAAPPGLGQGGASVGGPPVTRQVAVEQRVGGTLRVDASDAEAATLVDARVLEAVLTVMRDHPRAFAGLTWDGQHVAVHLVGPLVADAPRAAAVARRLWEPVVD